MSETVSAILSACADPVAVFTDFDGVLVEIAPTPESIVVAPDLRERLDRLETALEGAFAIVTGRAIADIDSHLDGARFSVSGGHGAERRHGGRHAGPPERQTAQAGAIARRVREAVGAETGILVESKPSGVAVHYRAAPERGAEARAALSSAIADFEGFHMIAGKKVIEARPRGADKGAATLQLMAMPPFANRMPVFVGDDLTDEDAFGAVQARGGIGVKVGPGETRARFRLPDVAAVHALLDALADRARQAAGKPRSEQRAGSQ